METLVENRIAGYRLDRQIASGGMAAVYEGRSLVNGAQVAVKVLRRDLRRSIDPLARLVQEGRVIISLLHEHIVRVLDYGTAEESMAFIVMELLRGQTLADLLDTEKRLDPVRAAFIASQVCHGLTAAHARGIFHRDIKPANIFLSDDQRHKDFVKIVDFGIAKLDASDPSKLAATATGMTLGTPEYMSPEQATAAEIDARSDVYQVGVMLFEMLSGDVPFTGKNPVSVMQKHLHQAPPSLRKVRPDVPLVLDQIVARCLAKEPAGRYASTLDLAHALEALAERETAEEGMKTIVDDLTATVVGGMRLPAIGHRGDLARYARSVLEELGRAFPADSAPQEIREIVEHIEGLREEQGARQMELTARRADAEGLATQLEARALPLERALRALNDDKKAQQQLLAGQLESITALDDRLRTLDAEFADLYEQIEHHQQTLRNADSVGHKAIGFRDLFHEEITSRMRKLEQIHAQRAEQAQVLGERRSEAVSLMGAISDLAVQITRLEMSRLDVEVERATRLAERERQRAEAELQFRGLERALEQAHLTLGLALCQTPRAAL